MGTGSFLLLLALAPASAQPDYFPLQVGNQWIYRVSGAAPGVATAEVVKAGSLNDRSYYLLRGIGGGETWVRMDESGTLYAYDAPSKTDQVWVAFASPEGAAYETAMHPCSKRATVASRSATSTTGG